LPLNHRLHLGLGVVDKPPNQPFNEDLSPAEPLGDYGNVVELARIKPGNESILLFFFCHNTSHIRHLRAFHVATWHNLAQVGIDISRN
jgi:hypothetical protein